MNDAAAIFVQSKSYKSKTKNPWHTARGLTDSGSGYGCQRMLDLMQRIRLVGTQKSGPED